jgi:hypothetical protein
MSWGISKRLRNVLGLSEKMNESPWVEGSNSTSENQSFSNKDLGADIPPYLQGADNDQFVSSETHFVKADIKTPVPPRVEQPRQQPSVDRYASANNNDYDRQMEERRQAAVAAGRRDQQYVGTTRGEGTGEYRQSDRSTAGRKATS